MIPPRAEAATGGRVTVFLIKTTVTVDAAHPAALELEQIVTERIRYRQHLLRAKSLLESGRAALALEAIDAVVND